MSQELRKEASRWLLRLQSEAVSAEDHAAFEAWYRAGPKNAEAFDALAEAVDRLRQLRGRIPEDLEPSDGAFSRSRRTILAVAAGGALAASLTGFAWYVGAGPWASGSIAFETGVGVQRQVALADGSQIELNTDTHIDVRISKERRHVKLARGEALFQVAHEPQRPFEVEADGYVLRAMGTVFSVRVDANATALLVIEGAVSVTPAGGGTPELVSAAERFDLVNGTRATALSAKDIERALAWRRGMLDFDGVPLGVVVAEVERYTGAHFTFADPSLAEVPMATYFRAADLGGFISRLESYPLLSVRATADGYLIERRPESTR